MVWVCSQTNRGSNLNFATNYVKTLIIESQNINNYHIGIFNDINETAYIKLITEALQMVDI